MPGTEATETSRTSPNGWMWSGTGSPEKSAVVSEEVMETEHNITGPCDVKAESMNRFALKLVVQRKPQLIY